MIAFYRGGSTDRSRARSIYARGVAELFGDSSLILPWYFVGGRRWGPAASYRARLSMLAAEDRPHPAPTELPKAHLIPFVLTVYQSNVTFLPGVYVGIAI